MKQLIEQKRLLIVDDEPEILEIIQSFMSEEKIECICCKGIHKAENIILNETIHGVFCDIQMPAGSGTDLLRNIRCKGMSTPFTFITAFYNTNNFLHAIQLGAFDFIIKPFQINHLIDVAHRMLELGKAISIMEKNIQNPDFGSNELEELQKNFPKLFKMMAHNNLKSHPQVNPKDGQFLNEFNFED